MWLLSYSRSVSGVAAVCPLEEIVTTEDTDDPSHAFLGPWLDLGKLMSSVLELVPALAGEICPLYGSWGDLGSISC